MSRVFAVTSGKGGAGKSTVAVGLAYAFASRNKRVLLVDLDEGLRCLDLMLGIDKELVFDLADILTGREIADGIYPVPGEERISLIPAPQQPGRIEGEAFSALLQAVIPHYDVVLLDFPAGVDFRLYSYLPAEVQYLAVCGPDPVSVRDASVVCSMLPQTKFAPLLILNRFHYDAVRSGLYQNIDDIIDASGFRLLGIVPQSTELLLLPVRRQLKPKERGMKALLRIAKRLDGEEVRLPPPRKI